MEAYHEAAAGAAGIQQGPFDLNLPTRLRGLLSKRGRGLTAALKEAVAAFAERRADIYCLYYWTWTKRTWDVILSDVPAEEKDAVDMLRPLCFTHYTSTAGTHAELEHPTFHPSPAGAAAGLRARYDKAKRCLVFNKRGVRRVAGAGNAGQRSHFTHKGAVVGIELEGAWAYLTPVERRQRPLAKWLAGEGGRPAALLPVHIYFRKAALEPVTGAHANFLYINKRLRVARFFEPHNVMAGGHYGGVQSLVLARLREACDAAGLAEAEQPVFEGTTLQRRSSHLQGATGDDLCQTWATFYAVLCALNPRVPLADLIAAFSSPQAALLLFYAWASAPRGEGGLRCAVGRCTPVRYFSRPFGPTVVYEEVPFGAKAAAPGRLYARVSVAQPRVLEWVWRDGLTGRLDVVGEETLKAGASPLAARLAAMVPWLNHRVVALPPLTNPAHALHAHHMRVRAFCDLLEGRSPLPPSILLLDGAGTAYPFDARLLSSVWPALVQAARAGAETEGGLPQVVLDGAAPATVITACLHAQAGGFLHGEALLEGLAALPPSLQKVAREGSPIWQGGKAGFGQVDSVQATLHTSRRQRKAALAGAVFEGLRIAHRDMSGAFAPAYFASLRQEVEEAGVIGVACLLVNHNLLPAMKGPKKEEEGGPLSPLAPLATAVLWEVLDGLAYTSFRVADGSIYRPSSLRREPSYLAFIRRRLAYADEGKAAFAVLQAAAEKAFGKRKAILPPLPISF